jgi:hypothetical protein
MIGAVIGLILLRGAPRRRALLRTNAPGCHPARRTILRIFIVLLMAIVVLYVIVVLLGFVGIHVPVPGFR